MAADTGTICASVASVPVPAADQARSTPKGCSAYRAYYGVGQPTDFALARACAFDERISGSHSDTPFRASAILAMIYANGEGVGRDVDLAIKFACEITDGAAAETEARVDHLSALRDAPGGRRFDLCDDITSGYMGAYCESKEADLADQRRDQVTNAIIAGATSSERSAFDKLQKAGEAYFTLNADSTVGTEGTLHTALEIASSEQQRTLFVETLGHLEKRQKPEGMEADFGTADRELNDVYRQLLETADPSDGITTEGLRKAERAWLVYRDRWLEFAHLRYPDLAPDQVKALLTRQRIAAINSVLHPPH